MSNSKNSESITEKPGLLPVPLQFAAEESPSEKTVPLAQPVAAPEFPTRRELWAIIGTATVSIAVAPYIHDKVTRPYDAFSRNILILDEELGKIRANVDGKIMANGQVPLAPRGKLALLQQLETDLNQLTRDNAEMFRAAPVLQEKVDKLRHDMRESERILGGGR